MRKRRKILMIVSLVIVAMIMIAVALIVRPAASVRSEEATFTLTASELVNAFADNESAANAMYVGKVLEVRGPLKETIIDDHSVILLLGDTSQMAGVSCYMQKHQPGRYKDLLPGGDVTVKGICNGMLLDVVLDKGLLLTSQ